MTVEYLKQFSKDIAQCNDPAMKKRLLKLLELVKQVETIEAIPHVKKLKGHDDAYRVRIGKYRLGFFWDGKVILLARWVKREDIYKLFP